MRLRHILPNFCVLTIISGSMAIGQEARAQAEDNNLEAIFVNDTNDPNPYDFQSLNLSCNNPTDPAIFGCYPGESAQAYIQVETNSIGIWAVGPTLPRSSPYFRMAGCDATAGVCDNLAVYASISYTCADGESGDLMLNISLGGNNSAGICISGAAVTRYDIYAWEGNPIF
jgi:hypothetical protein